MTTTQGSSNDGRRITGWVALIGAILCWLNVFSYLMATAGDAEGMCNPTTALSMAVSSQAWFRWSMLFDCFGFYLPFLIIGAFFWSKFRPDFSVLIAAATLGLPVYVLLGIGGAAIQIAALTPLSVAHGGDDAVVQAATESAWLAVVHLADRGLWWMEGPLMAFWGLVIGRALIASGVRYGRLLVVTAGFYAGWFTTAFLELPTAAALLEQGVLVLLPLWMLLTGIDLLRRRDARGGIGA